MKPVKGPVNKWERSKLSDNVVLWTTTNEGDIIGRVIRTESKTYYATFFNRGTSVAGDGLQARTFRYLKLAQDWCQRMLAECIDETDFDRIRRIWSPPMIDAEILELRQSAAFLRVSVKDWQNRQDEGVASSFVEFKTDKGAVGGRVCRVVCDPKNKFYDVDISLGGMSTEELALKEYIKYAAQKTVMDSLRDELNK